MKKAEALEVREYLSDHKDIQKVILNGAEQILTLETDNLEKARSTCQRLKRTIWVSKISSQEEPNVTALGVTVSQENTRVNLSGSLTAAADLLETHHFISSDTRSELSKQIKVLNGINFSKVVQAYREAKKTGEYSPEFFGAQKTNKQCPEKVRTRPNRWKQLSARRAASERILNEAAAEKTGIDAKKNGVISSDAKPSR